MINRCYYKYNKEYHNYGGRGIIVCDEWKTSYSNFYNWVINNDYIEPDKNILKRDRLSIDRIDPNGNYCPENCRFIPMSEQQKTTRKYLSKKNLTK